MADTGARETVGSLIRARRERAGMKPRALADAIGRTPQYVSLLETDKIQTPPPDVLGDVARALDLDELRLLRAMGYLRSVPTDGEQPHAAGQSAADPRARVSASLEKLPDWQVDMVAALVDTLLERREPRAKG